MNHNQYEQIRKENQKKHGTDVNEFGDFLQGIYSDKTHFVYELIQNAEDAYSRLNESNENSYVSFNLFPDRLEFRHSGIPFNEDDIRGICRLLGGTKIEDPSQIGKFGIGFKSVYVYTVSPRIYSEDVSFCIKNYVHPYPIDPDPSLKSGETLIVIPFTNPQTPKEMAFSEIKERLQNIGDRTLLFIKCINKISWVIEGKEGNYLKFIEKGSNYDKISISYKSNNKFNPEVEKWLVFRRSLDSETETVEIAYLIDEEKGNNKVSFKPVHDATLVVYFPTDKKTNINFLMQGSFDTTPARDNIKLTSNNEFLISEIGKLVSESIDHIKEMSSLDVNFLKILPLNVDDFSEDLKPSERSEFFPILQEVKNKLMSDGAYLPAYGGGFITPNEALFAGSQGLRELLTPGKLRELTNSKFSKWLSEDITKDKTPEIWNYLSKVLKIQEYDSEKFGNDINSQFLEEQSDDWIIRFYRFLIDQKSLWRHYGILRKKEIIRLDDDTHVAPYDSNGNLNVYLPSDHRNLFPTVKDNICQNPDAVEFLKNLGVIEPDMIAGIIDKILPLYENSSFKEEDNIQHIEWILKTLRESDSSKRKEELLEELKGKKILYAKNIASEEISLMEPKKIYLGSDYTQSDDIDVFFEGNEEIWLLDERYLGLFNEYNKEFKDIGCKSEISVSFKRPNLKKYVKIRDWHADHKRGLNGFDPDCNIEGLEFALENINIKRALVLWNLLINYSYLIKGEIESSTRQSYEDSEKETKFSRLGELVFDNPWLPDEKGHFKRPCEINLSDLHDEFDSFSNEAFKLAQALDVKTDDTLDFERELSERYPPEIIEFLELSENPSKEKREMISQFIKTLKNDTGKSEYNTPEEIREKCENSLKRGSEGRDSSSKTKQSWDDISPEDEETIRKNYGDNIPDRLNKITARKKVIVASSFKINDTIDPKPFLLDQYNGHCQICNTRLDLGDGEDPFISTFRIVETRNKYWWSDMEFNVMSVCPNCHALMKHQSDLTQIKEVAQKSIEGLSASQEVKERSGAYYVVDVVVAGKKKELFISQAHMAKIASLYAREIEGE